MPDLIARVSPCFHLYNDVSDKDASRFQQLLSKPGNKSNHGLRFTKFFGRWQRGSTPEPLKTLKVRNGKGDGIGDAKTDPLLDWLDPRKPGDPVRIPGHAFKGLQAGDSMQLEEACDRLNALSDPNRGGRNFELQMVSRLLIGIGLPHPVENGFLFHPTLGVPYLPGTALKQVAKDWAEEEDIDHDTRTRIFGSEKTGVGCVAFLDALPKKPLTLTAEQITNHYPGYYQGPLPGEPRDDMEKPADWYEPVPITLLAVEGSFAAAPEFCFGLVPLRHAKQQDVEYAKEWLTEGLEVYGAGARTTLGFGRLMSKEAFARLKTEREDRRKTREHAEQTAAFAQPPAVGDRVRILETEKKKSRRGFVGVISKIDDFVHFQEVFVKNDKGVEMKTRSEHIEKLP